MVKEPQKPHIVFFGTPTFSVFVLEELEKGGFVPSVVVTSPDNPAGRGMRPTPPPVKRWAETRGIPVLQPKKLGADFVATLSTLSPTPHTLFIVAAYGKIIPQEVLDIPEHGTLNVHPSLLPKYRGPSPLEAPILAGDAETGVSVMLVDEETDHGGIISNFQFPISNDDTKSSLGEKLFRKGGEMLVGIIPRFIAGKIEPQEQDHEKATFTKKITKEDGRIDLSDDPEMNWRKFRAYDGWPGTYFFTEQGARVKITDIMFEDGKFVIKKVIPEGKKEVDYADFLRG